MKRPTEKVDRRCRGTEEVKCQKEMKATSDSNDRLGGAEHLDVDCWCDPKIETFENGNRLIIHNDVN